MINLESITIQVPSELAHAYRQAEQKEQEQIQLKMSAVLQLQIHLSPKEKISQFRQTMDLASQEAQQNGLTPEILASILQEANE